MRDRRRHLPIIPVEPVRLLGSQGGPVVVGTTSQEAVQRWHAAEASERREPEGPRMQPCASERCATLVARGRRDGRCINCHRGTKGKRRQR